MSTLCFLFSTFNKQVYGKHIRVAKKNLARFEQVEEMLLNSRIELEDYALTTFADRVEVGVKLGFLPATVFISDNSLKSYVRRLEQGCEVTKKTEYSMETDWQSIELAYSSALILNIKMGYGWTNEEVEAYATTHGWTQNPNRTADLIEKVRLMQCGIHRCPKNYTYEQIGQEEYNRRLWRESQKPKTEPPPPVPPELKKPQKKKDWRFWRHPDEAPEDEDQ